MGLSQNKGLSKLVFFHVFPFRPVKKGHPPMLDSFQYCTMNIFMRGAPEIVFPPLKQRIFIQTKNPRAPDRTTPRLLFFLFCAFKISESTWPDSTSSALGGFRRPRSAWPRWARAAHPGPPPAPGSLKQAAGRGYWLDGAAWGQLGGGF